MEYRNILLEVKEDIALLTVNRPDKLNALNEETLSEIKSAVAEVGKNDSVSVLLITGSGSKAFVAGADIEELSKCDTKTGVEFAKFGQNVFNTIENLGKPVIALVNGYALGGGCELALACHIRLASERAKFGQPEVNLGIIPGYGGTQRLARIVNPGIAIEYILTGKLFDAKEALRIGLVNAIYPNEELSEKGYELAKVIASKGQIAVRESLKAIIKGFDETLEDGLELESNLFGKCCGTEDFKEGTSAFLNKVSPKFRGK